MTSAERNRKAVDLRPAQSCPPVGQSLENLRGRGQRLGTIAPMARFRQRGMGKPSIRRLGPRLALLAYFVAAFGFPVPTAPSKDRRHPFPCQDHVCGCCNAEDCWHHCCCFSHAEHLAWAHAHQVEALAPTESASACPPTAHGCCHHHAGAADRDPSQSAQPDSHATRHGTPGFRWVARITAFRCHALSPFWVSASPALPSFPEPMSPLVLPPSDSLVSEDVFPTALDQSPPVPPPRPTLAS